MLWCLRVACIVKTKNVHFLCLGVIFHSPMNNFSFLFIAFYISISRTHFLTFYISIYRTLYITFYISIYRTLYITFYIPIYRTLFFVLDLSLRNLKHYFAFYIYYFKTDYFQLWILLSNSTSLKQCRVIRIKHLLR